MTNDILSNNSILLHCIWYTVFFSLLTFLRVYDSAVLRNYKSHQILLSAKTEFQTTVEKELWRWFQTKIIQNNSVSNRTLLNIRQCMPILLYGLEVCNLHKRSMHSLDFTVNRFFMKMFKTSNMEIVKCCQSLFGCELPSVLLAKRYHKFIVSMSDLS